ncbi:hypothetical protein KSS87_015114 [Heliosperma pusillum]|nr:hypothetical protein KSS87_015114 [Heliosperma pusillum]
MEFFSRIEMFRLKAGHQNKYLAVSQDEESIELINERESATARWAIELVEGKSNTIRLRSCHSWKYLASTNKPFLLGMTGKQVAQRLRLDATVEWEPIKEAGYVKLKSHSGSFLRANRGPPPWRNSITHDPLGNWIGKDDMVLWIVDIVRLIESKPGVDNQPIWCRSASENGYTSDDQKPESFGKLKSMLAALEDNPKNVTEAEEM